jgi:PDZ domain-containing protein
MPFKFSAREFISKFENTPSFFIAIALLFGMALQGMPYVRSEPGSTYDSVGKIDGVDLLKIGKSEYPVFDANGELRILTVNSWGGPYGPLVFGDAMRGLWDRSITIEPVEFLYPEPVDADEEREEGQFQFSSSGNTALYVALTALEIPVTSELIIYNINPDDPAAKKLVQGDVLLALDGSPIGTFEELTTFMDAKVEGETITVKVKRGTKTKDVSIKLTADDAGKARIGIFLYTQFSGPMEIDVKLENVGGPSAGLVFTLGIYDKLEKTDLLKGRNIAGTGTMNLDGSVGAIGGLYQKMAAAARSGAEIMLIPAANCVDAIKVPAGLRVVPVESFLQAVDVLSGRINPLPACVESQ